jgi:hypothetical protein
VYLLVCGELKFIGKGANTLFNLKWLSALLGPLLRRLAGEIVSFIKI